MGYGEGPHLFGKLKSVIPKRYNAENGDLKLRHENFIFRLFYILTSIALAFLSAFIFLQRFMDEHISCQKSADEQLRLSAVNQYCFVTGTYTVTNYTKRLFPIGKYLPYPGVGTRVLPTEQLNGSHVKYHLYFQWVPFILGVQALLFRVPYLIWKAIRKDKLDRYFQPSKIEVQRFISSDHNPMSSRNEANNENKNDICPEHRFILNINANTSYAVGHVLCEILNLTILILAAILSNILLAGEFDNFGSDWLTYIKNRSSDTSLKLYEHQFDTKNPFDRVFPKVSKCEFKMFGPSGNLVPHDVLCILTLNVIHEKVFLIQWFWFWILVIAQVLLLIYRLALLLLGNVRVTLLMKRVEPTIFNEDKWNPPVPSGSEKRVIDSTTFKNDSKKFLGSLSYSDWFILKRISDNMTRFEFTKFLQNVLNYQYNHPNIAIKWSSNDQTQFYGGDEHIEMHEMSNNRLSRSSTDELPRYDKATRKYNEGDNGNPRYVKAPVRSDAPPRRSSVYESLNKSLLEMDETVETDQHVYKRDLNKPLLDTRDEFDGEDYEDNYGDR